MTFGAIRYTIKRYNALKVYGLKFGYTLLGVQTLIILLYTQASYSDETGHLADHSATDNTLLSKVTNFYGVFMDVHVMIFVGFGYLMTFLQWQGFGSVGFNFFIAALVMEWAMLVVPMVAHGFAGSGEGSIFDPVYLDTSILIEGDFAAATVLITFGGLLGKVGPLHLLVIGLSEVVWYAIDFQVVAKIGTLDVGGSLVIHAFGAYFGLACSYILTPKKSYDHPKNASSYNSDLFAMIGTVFLWLYWPSFVSCLVPDQREVAVLHTVLALCGSCVTAFAVSYAFENRFDMVHVQNATLAGGVAIGAIANMDLGPSVSMLVGCIAGLLSTVGYAKISPPLEAKKIHDTCGIHNLHGMPGVLGGVVSIFVVLTGGAEALHEGVSKGEQAAKQILGLAVAVAFAIISGLVTGVFAKKLCPPLRTLYEDTEFWMILEDFEPTAQPEMEVVEVTDVTVSAISAKADPVSDSKEVDEVVPADEPDCAPLPKTDT